MNQKLRLATITLFLMASSSFNAQAEGWYLGGGAVTSNLEDDLDDEISQGFGFALVAGYSTGDLFGIEFLLSTAIHEEDVTDGDLSNDTIMLGGKFSFGGPTFRPYIAGGISDNSVDFDNFDEITGDGTYWGIGADIFINQNHVINVSYRLNDWEGDDSVFDYDVSNKMLTVAYNFYFTR